MAKKVLPELDETSIGNVLVEMGLLTLESLSDLVNKFKSLDQDELLGQFIVKNTDITQDQLDIALVKQYKMRGKLTHANVVKALDASLNTQQKVVAGVTGLCVAAQEILKSGSG